MKKVLVAQHIHEEGIKLLEKDIKVIMSSNIDKETLVREAKGCDDILVRTANLSGEVINSAKKLKVIARHGVGVDNIDIKTATEQGIIVVNVSTAMVDSVAEHVMAMILALSKNLIKMAIEVAQGILDVLNKKTPKYIINPEVLGKHK